MPYPLLKLPYGLQRRLRSLTTPKEAYCLQVAAGFEQNYLQPPQMCTVRRDTYISNKDGNIILTYESPWVDPPALDYDNDSLILSTQKYQMHYLKSSDYDTSVFNHVLFSGPSYAFFKSVLNPAIFNKIVKQCKPEQVRLFDAVYYISPDLTIPIICAKFKNLQELQLESLDYASNNWMNDLLKFRKLNLSTLKVGGEFENLFSFEPDELSQFFKRENPEFSLTLVCWKPPNNAAELIREKFGSHFTEFDIESSPEFALVKKENRDGFLHIELEPSDYDSPVFNHVLFNGPYFTFFKSVLTPATFNKVLLQCQPEKVTMFAAICFISSELTIPFICATFKNIRQILLEDWDYALKNWMNDLLKFRKLNLSALKVGGKFKKLFSFGPDELSQLFEREGPKFSLCLACWKPPPNAIELIRKKFGAHFKEFFNVAPSHEEQTAGFLHIKLGNSFSGFKEFVVLEEEIVDHYWFQVKS